MMVIRIRSFSLPGLGRRKEEDPSGRGGGDHEKTLSLSTGLRTGPLR
jgi:hypothetical protein